MAYVLTYTNSFDDYVAMIRAKRSIGPMGSFAPYGPYIVVSLLYLAIVVLGQIWDGMTLMICSSRKSAFPFLREFPW